MPEFAEFLSMPLGDFPVLKYGLVSVSAAASAYLFVGLNSSEPIPNWAWTSEEMLPLTLAMGGAAIALSALSMRPTPVATSLEPQRPSVAKGGTLELDRPLDSPTLGIVASLVLVFSGVASLPWWVTALLSAVLVAGLAKVYTHYPTRLDLDAQETVRIKRFGRKITELGREPLQPSVAVLLQARCRDQVYEYEPQLLLREAGVKIDSPFGWLGSYDEAVTVAERLAGTLDLPLYCGEPRHRLSVRRSGTGEIEVDQMPMLPRSPFFYWAVGLWLLTFVSLVLN